MPFFEVEKQDKVALIYFNRPNKINAMNKAFWDEISILLDNFEKDKQTKVIVWAGKGKGFCAGLDLMDFFLNFQPLLMSKDAVAIEKLISELQQPFIQIANSSKIHIAAVHGACVGGGLDFAVACDLRFASQDAFFSLRETKMAIVADLGSLNRLPHIIGENHTRWMAFTGKDFSAQKVYSWGLVSEVFENHDVLLQQTLKIAQEIAENSSFILHGIKNLLNYQWNQTPEQGLKYIAEWNGKNLVNPDFIEMMTAFAEKRKPNFQ